MNKNQYMRLIVVGLCILAALTGCKKKAEPEEVQVTGNKVQGSRLKDGTLFTVGDEAITADMLQAYLALRPLPDSGDATTNLHERVDELLLNEALYQEALRRKLDTDPQIRMRMQQFLTQALLEQEVEGPLREKPVTEEQIRTYYEEHRTQFSRPEQVRLGEIFLAAADQSQREAQRALAQEVLTEALTRQNEARGFSELIKEYSDPPPNRRLGDTGYFDRAGQPMGLPQSVVEVGFGMTENGVVYDKVIKSEQGFHIVKLINRRAAKEQPWDEVRLLIERAIRDERLQAARERFFAEIRSKTQMTVDEAALEKLAQTLGKQQQKQRVPSGPTY
ncbi:peptidylprolyl isomerase [Planctomycetota bacterium]